MNRLPLFASLLLVPQLGGSLLSAAPLQDLDLFQVRDDAAGPAPEIGGAQVLPIDWREKNSGLDLHPTQPHLTADQLNTFSSRIYAVDRRLNGCKPNSPAADPNCKPNLKRELGRHDPLVAWLRKVVSDYDTAYSDVNPDTQGDRSIPTSQWDKILDAMAAKAETEYPKTHDWQATFTAMLKLPFQERLIDDPHSNYENKEEFAHTIAQSRGKFAGIGCQIAYDNRNEEPKDDADKAAARQEPKLKLGAVATCYPNSGAEKAQIQDDDVISAVYVVKDGVETRFPFAGQTLNTVVKNLLGTPGTQVKIEVIRKGTKVTPDPVITRSEFTVPTVLAKMLKGTKIAYVHFTNFDDTVAGLVKTALSGMVKNDGADAIIVDLRNNPGGNVETALDITSEFLKDGQDIFSYTRLNQKETTFVTKDDGKFLPVPVAVLINGGSASASEIFAQALQDNRCVDEEQCTVIVGGMNSFGKGSRQRLRPYSLELGAARVTEGEWRGPKFKNINAKRNENGREIPGTGGVKPNLKVDVDPKVEAKAIEARNRELLLRARDKARGILPSQSTVKDFETLEPDAVLEAAKKALSADRT